MLRYLSDAYRALRQTVPDDAKTEELQDLIEWLGELVRQVDSSLIDEWESLRNPVADPDGPGPTQAGSGASRSDGAAVPVGPSASPSVLANLRAFRVLVRNELFRRVQLAALEDWAALGELDAAAGFDADAWASALDPYFDDHDRIGTGGDARGPAMLMITEGPREWTVRQILDDPAGDHDWGVSATVDLEASAEAGVAVVRVTAVDRL